MRELIRIEKCGVYGYFAPTYTYVCVRPFINPAIEPIKNNKYPGRPLKTVFQLSR